MATPLRARVRLVAGVTGTGSAEEFLLDDLGDFLVDDVDQLLTGPATAGTLTSTITRTVRLVSIEGAV